jgi:hypothetical protein
MMGNSTTIPLSPSFSWTMRPKIPIIAALPLFNLTARLHNLVSSSNVPTKVQCAVAEIVDEWAGLGTIRTVLQDDEFQSRQGDNLGQASVMAPDQTGQALG